MKPSISHMSRLVSGSCPVPGSGSCRGSRFVSGSCLGASLVRVPFLGSCLVCILFVFGSYPRLARVVGILSDSRPICVCFVSASCLCLNCFVFESYLFRFWLESRFVFHFIWSILVRI